MTTTAQHDQLIRATFLWDENEYGEMAWTVTPYYRIHRHGGRVVSVPDNKGWPTLSEARDFAKAEGYPVGLWSFPQEIAGQLIEA